MITREIALEKLRSMVNEPTLLNHCLTVEKIMVGLARRRGLSEAQQSDWGIAGLIHDADWQRYPTEHPERIVAWLRQNGADEIAAAVAAHGVCWGMPYDTEMSKALVASDELAGFISAYARVRPDGLKTLTGAMVAKKLKNASFATGVSREEVSVGVQIFHSTVEAHADTIIQILLEEI